MPDPTITRLSESLLIDNVGLIEVSDIEQDTDGNYVRTVRVYSEPEGESAGRTLVMSLKVRAVARSSINVTTPRLPY